MKKFSRKIELKDKDWKSWESEKIEKCQKIIKDFMEGVEGHKKNFNSEMFSNFGKIVKFYQRRLRYYVSVTHESQIWTFLC